MSMHTCPDHVGSGCSSNTGSVENIFWRNDRYIARAIWRG